MTVITWYGHSAFKLECDGASVLIDPFFAPGGPCKWQDAGNPDVILVTHDHGDHVGDAVPVCQASGAMVGAVVGTAESLIARGVPAAQIMNGIGFNIGGTLEYKMMAFTMTQAMHTSDSGMPAGYIIRMPDGLTVYHAGDTGIFSTMRYLGELYPLDIALLPIGGVFTMDALQAAHACKLLGCKKVIPMHYGTFPVLAQSPALFLATLAKTWPDCQAVPLKIGESMEFAR